MLGRRVALFEGILYTASIVVAGLVALTADIPLLREWGRLALPSYAAGTLVAMSLATRRWADRRG
ncbi:MAG TPA: hypothetical protein VGR13_09785, partial [Actinomycetota bacterium]|nr:hypothetical protein [Actinomycetota bacterium]